MSIVVQSNDSGQVTLTFEDVNAKGYYTVGETKRQQIIEALEVAGKVKNVTIRIVL